MYPMYPVLIPITAAALWAVIHKLRLERFKQALLLLIIFITISLNAALTNILYSVPNLSLAIYFAQALLSCLIIPETYIYFAMQGGRPVMNRTFISMLALIALIFVPNICIDLSYKGSGGGTYDVIFPHSINFFKHGFNVFYVPVESVVVILQIILCFVRLVKLQKTMHRYELVFSPRMKMFFGWSTLCIVFLITYHLIPIQTWAHAPYIDVYFWTTVALTCTGFISVAFNMDLHPIQTKEGHESVQLERFIESNKDLAAKVRELLAKEEIYTRQGLLIDDMVGMIGTNRTYFTRMMRVEFGMSFTEYLHNVRVELCKKRLLESDDTLEDIAMDTGFGSASNLSRVFKKITGESPDAWRDAHKSAK